MHKVVWRYGLSVAPKKTHVIAPAMSWLLVTRGCDLDGPLPLSANSIIYNSVYKWSTKKKPYEPCWLHFFYYACAPLMCRFFSRISASKLCRNVLELPRAFEICEDILVRPINPGHATNNQLVSFLQRDVTIDNRFANFRDIRTHVKELRQIEQQVEI